MPGAGDPHGRPLMMTTSRQPSLGIIVVGASLAGLRASEALRAQGYRGQLTLVGDEPYAPYDRPPLSKALLAGTSAPEALSFPLDPDLGITLRLGVPAVRLDLDARTIELADSTRLPFAGLVIATGAAARPWPDRSPRGVHTLRGRDDALALRSELGTEARLLVVVGGFIGSEVAATARELGAHVTLVEAESQPLRRAMGEEAGRFLAEIHRAAGVDLKTGTSVSSFAGLDQLTGATLSDGTDLDATVAVVALGAVPNTDWLADSGLLLDRGVVCDTYCRALLSDGSPAPAVVAAGDVARWPHPWAGDSAVSLGHWSNAIEQAEAAAATLLAKEGELSPYLPVPSFWSDQYGVRFRSVGIPALGDEAEVVESDSIARRLEVVYYRQGNMVGVLTANRISRIAGHQRRLAAELAAGIE
ncbi:NAD(P)/FAD-dependent oxidoreductase [Streptomyces sp. SLBN-31]|uniref:NAD(P)/FAD-dependent oxidoreductase n=1 Tax=Streptomyces sp. SLBN-31 TaxID=2768444 RepID=UPI0021B2127A|nr:FAD-dependent oxidoreductase [Streptomyces sp. SLBN-31]